MNTIDKITYGNSACAIDLVDILNSKYPEYNRMVSRILNDYFSGVLDILKTESVTETLLRLWLEKYRARTRNSNLPEVLKTRVENLIVARYRIELEKIRK